MSDPFAPFAIGFVRGLRCSVGSSPMRPTELSPKSARCPFQWTEIQRMGSAVTVPVPSLLFLSCVFCCSRSGVTHSTRSTCCCCCCALASCLKEPLLLFASKNKNSSVPRPSHSYLSACVAASRRRTRPCVSSDTLESRMPD